MRRTKGLHICERQACSADVEHLGEAGVLADVEHLGETGVLADVEHTAHSINSIMLQWHSDTISPMGIWS